MKAIVLESKENPVVYKEVDKPTLQPGEVLVQIKAAALNRRDYWITIGRYAGIKYPSILGSDGAGTVAEVGSEQDNHWLNQEVSLTQATTTARVMTTRERILRYWACRIMALLPNM